MDSMAVRVRTAVGKREKGTWVSDGCSFPLVSEDYESPRDAEEHFKPKFSFRAAVFVHYSPLYPVAKHNPVKMKRSVEELVALYEQGRCGVLPPAPQPRVPEPEPVVETEPVAVTEGGTSVDEGECVEPVPAVAEDPPKSKREQRMSILIPIPEISISADQSALSPNRGFSDATPSKENSPLLTTGFGTRLLKSGRMLLPGQYPGPPPQSEKPLEVMTKLRSALSSDRSRSEEKPEVEKPPPSPSGVALLMSMFKPPSAPSPLAPEVVSDIASQEELPQQAGAAEVSPPNESVVVEIPKPVPLSKSSSAASFKPRPRTAEKAANAAPPEPVNPQLLPKMLLPQLPAFKSRRAKSGWKMQMPDLVITGSRAASRQKPREKTPELGIFGNEVLNRTLPAHSFAAQTPSDIYTYLEAQAEPIMRQFPQSFSAKKLPPHRMAVDFNLFKGVRRVAAMKIQMRKVRQQLVLSG